MHLNPLSREKFLFVQKGERESHHSGYALRRDLLLWRQGSRVPIQASDSGAVEGPLTLLHQLQHGLRWVEPAHPKKSANQ